MAHSSANLTKDTQQTLLLSNKHVYSCYQKTSKRPYLFSPTSFPKGFELALFKHTEEQTKHRQSSQKKRKQGWLVKALGGGGKERCMPEIYECLSLDLNFLRSRQRQQCDWLCISCRD